MSPERTALPPLPAPPPLPDATPAAVHGLLQVLNTRANEHFGETLGTKADADRYLAATDLRTSRADLRRLHDLRAAVVAALADPAATEPWRAIDALARRTPMRLSFATPGAARLEPTDDDAVAELLTALGAATTSGAWERLRLCARPQCRLAFYDATRSRTARWCSHQCGNRTHVAAHRARRATAPN
jgi:predicted RNA-binding Zn ribbon-like protein